MNKLKNFITEHPEISSVILLSVLCYLFLFFGLNFYNLIDVDETRYAVIARDMLSAGDWNILNLNSHPFLEKPPLYFWFVATSIKIFKTFTPFVVRLPIALLSSFLIFFTYFLGKKVLSRKFGLVSSTILLTSSFFLLLSHIAILDMLLNVFMASSLYCGYLALIRDDKFKKYLWWGFWLFAGLGFLAKGILAVAIPLVVIFTYCLITKKLKELFNPINCIIGLIIFLLIIIPWHLVMYNNFGMNFINEYFVKHHFARLLNSHDIGRKHGFFYFFGIFGFAFLPWILIFIGALCNGFKFVFNKFSNAQGTFFKKLQSIFNPENDEERFVLFFSIFFVVVFGVMSVSSTKLPTYILPALPAASILTGYLWCNVNNNIINKTIIYSTNILAVLFAIIAILAVFAYKIFPSTIASYIYAIKYNACICCLFLSILLVYETKKFDLKMIFTGYILSMLFVIMLAVTTIFNIIYNCGEHELVYYSDFVQTYPSRLVTFDFPVKPSVKINHPDYVYFITDRNFVELENHISIKFMPVYVIVKNKEVKNGNYKDTLEKNLYLLHEGTKYSLYVNKKIDDKQKVIQVIQ